MFVTLHMAENKERVNKLPTEALVQCLCLPAGTSVRSVLKGAQTFAHNHGQIRLARFFPVPFGFYLVMDHLAPRKAETYDRGRLLC